MNLKYNYFLIIASYEKIITVNTMDYILYSNSNKMFKTIKTNNKFIGNISNIWISQWTQIKNGTNHYPNQSR